MYNMISCIYNYEYSYARHTPACVMCLMVDPTAPYHIVFWAQSLCIQETSCPRRASQGIHYTMSGCWVNHQAHDTSCRVLSAIRCIFIVNNAWWYMSDDPHISAVIHTVFDNDVLPCSNHDIVIITCFREL